MKEQIPSLEYTPEKRTDFFGIWFDHKNPGTKRVLKCSTPILGESKQSDYLPTVSGVGCPAAILTSCRYAHQDAWP